MECGPRVLLLKSNCKQKKDKTENESGLLANQCVDVALARTNVSSCYFSAFMTMDQKSNKEA
jgi:hypothetical protein